MNFEPVRWNKFRGDKTQTHYINPVLPGYTICSLKIGDGAETPPLDLQRGVFICMRCKGMKRDGFRFGRRSKVVS